MNDETEHSAKFYAQQAAVDAAAASVRALAHGHTRLAELFRSEADLYLELASTGLSNVGVSRLETIHEAIDAILSDMETWN